MLGIKLVDVESDNFKINTKALEKSIKTVEQHGIIVAIVGIAGETETGLVENIQELAKIAKEHDIYFHVDAAYGGPFILSRASNVFKGISQADSITVDPHKMLYTPYPAGAIILKNKEDHYLISKFHEVNYLRNVVPRVLGSMTSAGVISTWATIKLFGAEGIASLLNHTLDLVDYAYKRSQESEVLEPMYKPELNTLLIKISDEFKDTCTKAGLTNEQINEKIMGNEAKGVKSMEDEVYNRMVPKDTYIAINSNTDHDSKRKFVFPVFRFLATHPYTSSENVEEAITFLETTLRERMGLAKK
jgi:glutamate/tyrosine decarboxylase-like PLP-dependent enzyme